ncbi:MAG: hypothetical protein JO189_12050, partial [Deltaproteobacteria bacterium]|nr:hypothetical protein [Deltaproteobacteria bacterium]
WSSKTYYTQLRLDPLGKKSMDEMLNVLLGTDASLIALKRLIAEKAEGNPLFMEEIILSLFEDGTLVRNGEVKLAKPLASLRIPPTVQGILAARIDRLPPDEKDLLQLVAVIGNEFNLTVVRALSGKSDYAMNRVLNNLQVAEFVYEQPAAGDVEYTFKHALIHDVAYNSILVEQRRQIHHRAAQAIESLFAESLADHYGGLARHYSHSSDGLKAAYYLQLAAQQAIERGTTAEARSQLTNALDLLGKQPDSPERDRTEIAVRLSLANCIIQTTYFTERSEAVLQVARELCEKLRDDVRLSEVLWALYFQLSARGEHQRARPIGEELLAVAERTNNTDLIGRARTWLMFSSIYEGDFLSAQEQVGRINRLPVNSIAKPGLLMYNWRVQAQAFGSFTLWALGFPRRAAENSRKSIELARQLTAARLDVISVLWWAGFLNLLFRNWDAAYSYANEALSLAHEQDSIPLVVLTSLMRGWALARGGHLEDGIGEMLRLRSDALQMEGLPPLCLSMGLADVYLYAHRSSGGLKEVDRALEIMKSSGSRSFEAEMRRLRGELLLIEGNGTVAGAVRYFHDAIEVAQHQSAKLWELRATTSLARLLIKQGRRDKARSMLAEIYDWFTEGFDTADLKDAKALLDELERI